MKRGRTLVKTGATSFGRVLLVWKKVPDDADLIVVCINRGGGYVPKLVLLPGQLYRATIEELIAETPDIRSITVLPARSGEHLDVWERS